METIGVVLVCGLIVYVFVRKGVFHTDYGYHVPRIDTWGIGHSSPECAEESAHRGVDRATEVDWE